MKKSTSRTVLDYDTDPVDNVTRIRTKNPDPGQLSKWYDQSKLKQGIGKVGS